jgi:hypothetical protein
VLRLLAAVSGGLREHGLRLERVPVNGRPGALLVDAEGGIMTRTGTGRSSRGSA